MPRKKLIPSKVVMEEFVEPAMSYYDQIIDRISPYFFTPTLTRLVGFQQLIVSRSYQIKREDARTTKGVDYVRECVSRIKNPRDLISTMWSWLAFDLNLTTPAFHDPILATHIRKAYCLIGTKYWDCHNCPRTPCRENLYWEKSFVGLDIDAEEMLEETFKRYLEFFNEKGWSAAFKLSSLKGYHINVALPKSKGSTPFDRNMIHWTVIRAIQDAGLPVDDNSLDPLSILRAPFALHYKRLTPSLPFDEGNIHEAIEILMQLEQMDEHERIKESVGVVRSWKTEWVAPQVPSSVFEDDLTRWQERATKAIFREIRPKIQYVSAASPILRKGRKMTVEDEERARSILLSEGKKEEIVCRILANVKKQEPKIAKRKVEPEVKLRDQSDVPEVVLNIPPPLLFLLIDNSTVHEMQELVGGEPVSIKSIWRTTNEGMDGLFRGSRFFRRYGRKWNTKTAYIGGLHSAYIYCGAADFVLSVKETSPWERDAKVVDELERALDRGEFGAIVVHLLGLDYCKDQGLPTDGAMLVFKRLTRAALETDRNIVVTTDHCGESVAPFFALLTSQGGLKS